MIGQTRYILMKCLSLTYYQSQQLQDINRKPPRQPIALYRHVKPLGKANTYHQPPYASMVFRAGKVNARHVISNVLGNAQHVIGDVPGNAQHVTGNAIDTIGQGKHTTNQPMPL